MNSITDTFITIANYRINYKFEQHDYLIDISYNKL